MRSPSGYKITESLLVAPTSCVYRGVRECDQTGVILRTGGEQSDASHHSRLRSSYEILKDFNHPNIIKITDLIDFSGQPCLVMDDSQSIDLWKYAATYSERKLPLETVLTIAIQLADALSVIHHAQVIHKDLHPGNILINPVTLNVQIIDFGLASLLSREQPALAPPENLEGILAYISPEQTGRMNRSLDYRSDFYTLGVTLYLLLTGKLPFEADDAIGLVYAHIARLQIPVCEHCPELPKAASDIINKLLSKTAEGRYQSALGLKQDLDICRRHVLAGADIPDFTLGLNDVSGRFQVPQILYGREPEINQLMSSFYLAAKGQPQLLSVEGVAGIGKSALVHEVHKVIAAHSGVFTRGKFDQFQKNVPYSALKQVFADWIQYALSLKETALINLREQLTQTLGANARVLVDFLESFELVLGVLAPVPVLGAQETQNRFHLVLQRFIQLISQDRPLVIFIDDIQWADRGTLNLLPLLMRLEGGGEVQLNESAHSLNRRLLLLVAYRDNEVDEMHPAIVTLEQIRHDYDAVAAITLKPLTVENINQLLVDALKQRLDKTLPLAKLVHLKTAGNPFFVNEFLKTLYSEKLLNFDLTQQQWIWDLNQIKAQAITNNVLELMLAKMQQLPAVTQRMIQLASCIGGQFDLQTLSVISEQSMSETVRQLWPALKEGLLLQQGGDWLLGATERGDNPLDASRNDDLSYQAHSTRISPLVPQCKFLHDRMLQAAYQSLDESEHQQAHLTIGRLLLTHALDDELDSQVFLIVEQMNQGRAHIIDIDERVILAQLNLKAALKAKESSVWEAAAQYAAIGVGFLPDDTWQTQYLLSFELYRVIAESEYLIGNIESSEAFYQLLLTHTKEGLEKAKICATRLVQMIGQGEWEKGIEIGILGMKYLEIEVSAVSNEVDSFLEKELTAFEDSLKGGEISNFIHLPEMTDERYLIAVNILPNLSVCSYVFGRTTLMKYYALVGINISLEKGKSDLMAALLACYAVVIGNEGEYAQAIEFAKQVLKISELYPNCREYANSLNLIAATTLYLDAPYQKSIDYHYLGYKRGMEIGELARAIISYSNTLCFKVSQGESLSLVERFAGAVCRKQNTMFLPVPFIAHKMVKALISGSPKGYQDLADDEFDVGYLSKIKATFFETILLEYQSQLAFWYDEIAFAMPSANRIQSKIVESPKFCFFLDHLIQYGLMIIQQSAIPSAQEAMDLDFCLQKLQKFAELYPPNFEHKYLLLQAEYGRYNNEPIEQLAPLYEGAINSAAENGFLQYEALANELYGAFWLSKNLNNTATPFLKDALYLYRRWGCMAKVNNLGKRYKTLLVDEHIAKGRQSEKKRSLTTSLKSMHPTKYSSTQISTQDGLDLSSVMKSAQAISSELEVQGLVAKVMMAIVENSGAQNGALILDTPKGATIQASLKTQASNDINLEPCLLDDATDLPVSLISYVLRTDSDLILQDEISVITSSANTAFIDDPYLQRHQPKSVLCIPVDYRENVIGALYLEHTEIHHAFPQERFNIIKMLLAQAAISFENARLFNEVSELNTGLEEKVLSRTKELNLAVKDLKEANKELDSFSYTVSHDLRAPLRSIRGFSNILIEDYANHLPSEAHTILNKVVSSAEGMSSLINGLLDLSLVQKQSLIRSEVSLSDMAESIIHNLRVQSPSRNVKVKIQTGMSVNGDPRMLSSVLENLLNNAWKYSSKVANAEISFIQTDINGKNTYVLQDNGAGFDMQHIEKLFVSFQRLHADKEFAGTGVGLATVKRIVNKHGGEIWAEAQVGKGAIFYFTLD